MRRETEVASLTRLLREAKPGLQVAAITGPGGVGKSYLLEEVFSQENPRDLEFMHLSIDGSNPQTRSDFMGLVEGQLAARSLPPPARPENDYFPQLRDVARTYREVRSDILATVERDKKAPPELRKAVVALLRTGHALNKTLSGSAKRITDFVAKTVDEQKVADLVEAGWDAIAALQDLAPKFPLPGILNDLLGVTKRNRVKQDLYNFTADALVGDVAAALDDYRPKDWYKFTHAPIPEFKKLLIVFDDFEVTSPVLSDFVISSLMPRLAKLSFPVVMLIACRDHLGAMHPGFDQTAKKWIVEDIRLSAFNRETAFRLMSEANIAPDKQEHLFEVTHGFPYLLSLVIEQATQPDAQSALFAKKFYDRTTRWMTDGEKEWFQQLCYLDVINDDTIETMLGTAVPATTIQNWFEQEASIRDPVSTEFTIRPLVRDKCLEYFAKRSPLKHKKMTEQGHRINELMAAVDSGKVQVTDSK